MTKPKVRIYIEYKPEHYVGCMSLVIQAKPSEYESAKLLAELISTFEGYDVSLEDTNK